MIESLILFFGTIVLIFLLAVCAASFLITAQGIMFLMLITPNITKQEDKDFMNSIIKKDTIRASFILVLSTIGVIVLSIIVGSIVEKREIKLKNKQQEVVLIKWKKG